MGEREREREREREKERERNRDLELQPTSNELFSTSCSGMHAMVAEIVFGWWCVAKICIGMPEEPFCDLQRRKRERKEHPNEGSDDN